MADGLERFFVGQIQLLSTPLTMTDVVYTPQWLALDMIEHFRPSGKVLEPSAGDGAFLRFLPGAEWCEIAHGRDFFAYHDCVDWCIGNPPYGLYLEWMAHSMEISNDIVYLLPTNKPFVSFGSVDSMRRWGQIKHMRHYAGGRRIGFPFGFSVSAVHFQRGYFGCMSTSYFDDWHKARMAAKQDLTDTADLPLFA